MYGDILYCIHCKKTFKDVEAIHDSRKEMVEINCPFCLSNRIKNISETIEMYEKSHTTKLDVKHTVIYNKFKKLEKKHGKRKVLTQERIFYPTSIIKRWEEYDKLYKD